MKLFGGKRDSQRAGGRSAPRRASDKKTNEPGADGPAGRGGGKKHRLTGLQRGLLLLLAALLVLVGVVYGVYKAMVRPPEIAKPNTGTNQTPDGDDGDDPNDPFKYTDENGEEVQVTFEVPGSHKEGFYNILLLGTDGDGTRTDTIMIARLNTKDHTVALMSVPRDTLINGNYSVPKINSVYGGNGKGEKGVNALKKQLASILGFEVDGYVMVELQAFVEIVDHVGGVPFNVPQNMYYNDPTQDLYINLSAGEQVLDGQHAMQLVRYRSYAGADIQRTKVQQDFIKALAKQCMSFKTITKIKPIVETCIEYVDTDLTLGNMLYFAQELLKCDFDQMEAHTLPGQGVWINGGSYYSLFASQVLEIVNESFNPYDTDIPLSSLHIRSGGGSSYSSGASSKPSSGSSSSGSKPAAPPVQTPSEPEDPDDPDHSADPDDPGDNPNDPGDPGTPADPDDPGASTEEPPDPVVPVDPDGGESNGADILDPGAPSQTEPGAGDTPVNQAPAEQQEPPAGGAV